MAERSGLLLDWGGVMTTNLLASFSASTLPGRSLGQVFSNSFSSEEC